MLPIKLNFVLWPCLFLSLFSQPSLAADYFTSLGIALAPAGEVSFQDRTANAQSIAGSLQQSSAFALNSQTGLLFDFQPLSFSLAGQAMVQGQGIESYQIDGAFNTTEDSLFISSYGLSGQVSYHFWPEFRTALSLGAGIAMLDFTQGDQTGYDAARSAYLDTGIASAFRVHERIEIESALILRHYSAFEFAYLNDQRSGLMLFSDKRDLRFQNSLRFYF